MAAFVRNKLMMMIAYNFSHFAIYLPKFIKLCGNLTK